MKKCATLIEDIVIQNVSNYLRICMQTKQRKWANYENLLTTINYGTDKRFPFYLYLSTLFL